MSSHYTKMSSFIYFSEPGEKNKIAAEQIIARVVNEIETDENGTGECFVNAKPEEKGVWLYNDENCDMEHAAEIARQIIEAVDCKEPFVCSGAFTCSKPAIDEFGGVAFAMKRGVETVWCDPVQQVTDQINN